MKEMEWRREVIFPKKPIPDGSSSIMPGMLFMARHQSSVLPPRTPPCSSKTRKTTTRNKTEFELVTVARLTGRTNRQTKYDVWFQQDSTKSLPNFSFLKNDSKRQGQEATQISRAALSSSTYSKLLMVGYKVVKDRTCTPL